MLSSIAYLLLFLLGQLPHGRPALLSWRLSLTLNLKSLGSPESF